MFDQIASRRRQLLICAFAFAVVAVIGWILFGSQNSNHPAAGSPPADIGHARLGTTSLSAGFGSTEAVPSGLRRRIANNTASLGELGLDFDLAQHVRTETGADLWLVEGLKFTCLVDSFSSALGCDKRSNADYRGMYIATYQLGPPPKRTPSEFHVIGIAPERLRAIPAEVHGRRISIPVRSRIFERVGDSPIRILLFNTDGH